MQAAPARPPMSLFLQLVLLIGAVAPAVASGCNKQATRMDMMKCMSKARTQAQMKSCKDKAGSCAPSTKDLDAIKERAGMTALSQCKIQGRSDCDKVYADITGKNMSSSGDARKQEMEERRMVREGLKDAVGQSMMDCMNASTTDAEKQDCRSRAMEQYKNATGGSGSTNQALMDSAVKKAGDLMAGKLIRKCIEEATTAQEKTECFSSTAAKEQAALASGRRPEDLTADDLKRAAMDSAKRAIGDSMSTCMSSATTAADKKACRAQSSLKDLISNSEGKTTADVKDSDVRKYIDKDAQDKVLEAMKACAKSQDAADIQTCKEEARRIMAEASGKDTVTDFDVAKSKMKALSRDIARIMKDCMSNATTSAQRAECKTAAEEALKEADPRGQAPPKSKMVEALKEAAMSAVKEVGDACTGTKEACFDAMKERIAQAKGVSKDDLTDEEAKSIQLEGALNTAKEAAQACAEARKDDSSATCESPYDTYLKVAGKTKPTDAKERKTEERRVLAQSAQEAIAQARKVCFELATKAEIETCMDESKGDTDSLFDHLMSGANLGAAAKSKRKERAKEEAGAKALGDVFKTCMKAATNQTEKDDCLNDMKDLRDKAGINETSKALLHKARARLFMDQGAACDGANASAMKSCREHAKKEAIAMGMKAREFAVVKKLGEVKAAATVWAACKDAGEADADCDDRALEEFKSIAGMNATSTVPGFVLNKVRMLGQALASGEPLVTVFKKLVEASTSTDSSDCDSAIEDKMALSTDSAATTADPNAGAVTKRPCRVVDGFAEYSADIEAVSLTDPQIDSLSASVAGTLSGKDLSARRLSEEARRLATVSEAHAAQVVDECPASDSSCNSETSRYGTSSSSSSSGSSSGPGIASGAAPQSSIFAVLAPAASFLLLAAADSAARC